MKRKATLSLFFCLLLSIPVTSQTPWERAIEESTSRSLPLVNIEVDVPQLSKENYIRGHITIFDLEKRTEGRLSASFECKVKYRGASTMRYEKKSFAIKLLDENGESLDANVLGIRNENDWMLDAMATDRIRMRNRVCFDIWNEMNSTPYHTDFGNRNGTKGEYVELYLNSEYHGLYCLSDKIDRKLLGLKKTRVNDDGSVTIRGVLYKGNSWTNATLLSGYDASASTSSETWNGWELQHPDDNPCHEAWKPLMDIIDFCSAYKDVFTENYKDHFYMDNLIDYALFLMGQNIVDNILKNAHLSCPDINAEQKFIITPWDLDCSLGGLFDGSHYEQYATFDNIKCCKLYYVLLNNVEMFNTGMKERWEELSACTMSQENFERHLDHYAKRFRESGAWQREYDKWNGNPVPLDLDSELDYVKEWYAVNHARLDSIFGVETGIQQTFSHASYNGVTYLIDGRRIAGNPAKRGIYIKDGRKIAR